MSQHEEMETPLLENRLTSTDSLGDDGYDPTDSADIAHKQTPAQFTLNMVKMTLGTASFALPWGFKKAGLLGGAVGVCAIGLMVYATMHMLVCTKYTLEKRLRHHPDYAEMASCALGGPWAGVLVKVATTGSCIGACAGYLTFVGELLANHMGVPQNLVVLCVAPVFALLSLLRTYRLMSFFSLFGDVSFFLALSLVLFDGFSHHRDNLHSPLEYPAFHPSTYMLFFGPTTFIFTVHYCMVPMESELKEPRTRVFGSLMVSTVFCVVIDILIGALGYMFYGEDTQDLVLNNIAKGPLTTAVIFLLVVELCFTYVLLLAPPRIYLERALLGEHTQHHSILASVVLRLSMVSLTVAISIGIPKFSIIAGFVGGLTDSLQAFILPPLLYMMVHKDTNSRFVSTLLLLMAAFGVAIMCLTTYQNIEALRYNALKLKVPTESNKNTLNLDATNLFTQFQYSL